MTAVAPLDVRELPLDVLVEAAWNANRVDAATLARIRRSIETFGIVENLVVRPLYTGESDTGRYEVLSGNHRLRLYRELGLAAAPCHVVFLEDAEARLLAQVLNRTRGEDDPEAYARLLREILADIPTGDVLSFLPETYETLEELLGDLPVTGGGDLSYVGDRPTLSERFVVPPLSVLDARQGYWLERKRRWLSVGIESELGRRDRALIAADSGRDPDFYRTKQEVERMLGRDLTTEEFTRDWYVNTQDGGGLSEGGTSVFDPVLCELVYRWFSAPGARVLDPFAGGSVRGVVAGLLGRRYVGVDLSAEQVAANKDQAGRIFADHAAGADVTDPDDLTPVEEHGDLWLKRDDLFVVNGARGGKARAILALAAGSAGLVGVGARTSPQLARVARVAAHLGVPCRVHTGAGSPTAETEAAAAAGAEVVQHSPARVAVANARAREDAAERAWTLVPFGAVCETTVELTRRQAANLPAAARRIVVPVGSGTTLAGVLRGLDDLRLDTPVLGVRVGADPSRTLDEHAPGWRDRVELVTSPLAFDEHADPAELDGIPLDPTFEAKCVPYLEPGDCLWVVGIGETHRPASGPSRPRWIVGDSADVGHDPESFDLVFSCPPYYDLEVYSDDPRDLSAKADYDSFLSVYGSIIHRSAAALRPDRFAVFVVGDVRARDGIYHGLVEDTIRLFDDAGLGLYNHAILVTPVGSLPVRASKFFPVSRKLGKTHQDVLVFVKGDPRRAVEAAGPVDVADPPIDGVDDG